MSGDGLFHRLAERLDDTDATFTMVDLLDLPAPQLATLRHVMRRAEPPTVTELIDELGVEFDLSAAEVGVALDALVQREALVQRDVHVHVAPIAATRRSTPGGIWDRLAEL